MQPPASGVDPSRCLKLSSHAHQLPIRRSDFSSRPSAAQTCSRLFHACHRHVALMPAIEHEPIGKIHGSPNDGVHQSDPRVVHRISFGTAVPLPEFPYGTPSWTLILVLDQVRNNSRQNLPLPFNCCDNCIPSESMSSPLLSTSSLSVGSESLHHCCDLFGCQTSSWSDKKIISAVASRIARSKFSTTPQLEVCRKRRILASQKL